MKFVSTVYAEIAMIIVILEPDEVTDVIKDFIVLGFIIDLDDLFATTGVSKEEL